MLDRQHGCLTAAILAIWAGLAGILRVRESNQPGDHLIAEWGRPDREAAGVSKAMQRKGLKSVFRESAAIKGIGSACTS